jgi:hypothetical protein
MVGLGGKSTDLQACALSDLSCLLSFSAFLPYLIFRFCFRFFFLRRKRVLRSYYTYFRGVAVGALLVRYHSGLLRFWLDIV